MPAPWNALHRRPNGALPLVEGRLPAHLRLQDDATSCGDALTDTPLVFPWPKRRVWAAFAAYWIVFMLLFAGSRFAQSMVPGNPYPMTFHIALGVAAIDTIGVAVRCLGAFALAWNLPLEGARIRRARNLVGALVGAVVAVFAIQWAQTTLASSFAGVPAPPLGMLLVLVAPSQLFMFTCFIAAGYAIRYYVRAVEGARAAAQFASESSRLEGELTRAELQLARTQLQVLKMQLDPHFLFNTFNAVSALMHRDSSAADEMLTRLSDLLRMTLSRSGDQEVTLHEELEFLRLYLKIQQTRFGPRLSVLWEVESGTERACVPHLLLQPIVENALEHGIERIPGPGSVRIRVRRDGPMLVVEVTDSGPGLAVDWVPRPGGVGLANTHARLEQMYGDRHNLEMYTPQEGGTVVMISLPFHTANDGVPCAS